MNVSEAALAREDILGGTLPQFQARLELITRSANAKEDAFVALRVDKQNWLIDLGHLLETSVPPSIAKGGRAPLGVVGIGNFRGEVLTMIDLQALLIGRPLPDPQLGWATPLHPRLGVALALLWTDLVGLVPKSEFSPISPSNETEEVILSGPELSHPEWIANRWLDKEGKEWWEFDTLQFILPEVVDGWMNMDSGDIKV